MTREEFIQKCNDIIREYRDNETFDKCINEILDSGCINLDKVPQDYTPAYWVVGALLTRTTNQCLNGSAYDERRRKARKEAKNIAYFIPTWF